MQFTGTSSVKLPNVNGFSFSLTGIVASDTGLVNLSFADDSGTLLPFCFSGGYIVTDKIIGTYNLQDESNIEGYYSNGVLNYNINGIYNQTQVSFSRLDRFIVSCSAQYIFCDLLVGSQPINYSVSFSPSYDAYGTLTGTIVSDTPFVSAAPSFIFYNTNKDVLGNSYSTGININSGVNYLSFPDSDDSFFEYVNNFFISIPTTFGDIGSKFYPYRGGVTNQGLLSLSDANSNNYYQQSLFGGSWSGDSFTYSDSPVSYNLNFNYGNQGVDGTNFNSKLSIAFSPIYPTQGGNYDAKYVTGFHLLGSGSYQTPPTPVFSEYSYVTGIEKSFQNFLFSTGCLNSVNVYFLGGSPTSDASGVLNLKTVSMSGVYNNGIQKYNVATSYSGLSVGSGYRSAPAFYFSTGGGCYSVPDASGYETSQFKFASGYGSTYEQAGGLTGLVVMSGSGVAGIFITNIGFGYNDSYVPSVTFLRNPSDSGVYDASGLILMKSTGIYDFNTFWNISCDFGGGPQLLSGYGGYYSGDFGVLGNGKVSLGLNLSGIDNTSPISGLLSVTISGNGASITTQKTIYQSRLFDLNTGSLYPNSYPVYGFVPLPDLSQNMSQSQSDSQYQNDVGVGDNIINF